MGFWSSVGKFAGKAAIGIIAPGALAGYEYQKQKQIGEAMSQFDEAIEALFQGLSIADKSDGWSELLVIVRNTIVGTLKDTSVRDQLLKNTHPYERGRVCCDLAVMAADSQSARDFASQKGVDIKILLVILNLQLKLCVELDNKLMHSGMSEMEQNVTRFLFDILCTRQPHICVTMYVSSDNDILATFNKLLKNIMFPAEDDEHTQTFKNVCSENNVSYADIKRKLGVV